MSERPLGQQTGWKWWGKVLEAGGPGLPSAGVPLLPIPHCSVPPMAGGGVRGQGSQERDKSTLGIPLEPAPFPMDEG